MGSTVVVPVLESLRLGDGLLLMPAVLPIWIMVGQGLTVLAVAAGVDYSDIFFSRLSFLFSFSLSLWNGWVGNLWLKSFSTEF